MAVWGGLTNSCEKKRIEKQRRHIDGQWVHKKMLIITNHQRNATQNLNGLYHLTPVKMAIIKKTK